MSTTSLTSPFAKVEKVNLLPSNGIITSSKLLYTKLDSGVQYNKKTVLPNARPFQPLI